MNFKNFTGIIPVYFHGKSSQRHHVDSVSIFQNIKISIADAVADHCCHAGSLPYSRAHPHHIMISPLDIKGMIIHKAVHNKMRSRASVINISQNMKMIYNQPLYQLCQGNDKILCAADVNNSIHNGIIIRFFVQYLCFFCDQLFDHIGIISRQSLTDLRPCIFGSSCFTQLDQTVQCDLIPVLHVRLCFLYIGDLLFWIIHKSSKRTLVTVTQSVSEYIVYFFPHCTGTVP